MNDQTDFKVGDAVRLRVDGSPEMIVSEIETEGRLVCVWKDGAGNTKSHAFPSRSLRAIEPRSDGDERDEGCVSP